MSRPAFDADVLALQGQHDKIGRVSRAAEKPCVPGGRPKMPAGFSEAQQALWKAIVRQLSRRRTLTPGDQQILTLYVRTFTQWESACQHAEKFGAMLSETRYSPTGEPYTVEIQNPAVKLAAALAAQLESFLKEMGMTGVTRQKVAPVETANIKAPPEPGTAEWFAQVGIEA